MEPANSLWKSQQKREVSHETAISDKCQSFVGAITEAQVQAQEIPFPHSAFGEENSLLHESFEPPEIAQAPDLVFSLDQDGNVIGSTPSALALDPLPQPEFPEGQSGAVTQGRSDLVQKPYHPEQLAQMIRACLDTLRK